MQADKQTILWHKDKETKENADYTLASSKY